MRGLGDQAQGVRPGVKIVEGRMFQPGKREMVVGVGAQALFQNKKIGDKVILPDGQWPIVARFLDRRSAGRSVDRRYRDPAYRHA